MTETSSEAVIKANTEASEKTVQSAVKSATAAIDDATKSVTESKFFTQAKDVIGQAVETTIEAVKEHPITAAAIGAGVAATVAGAAFGVSKLLEDDAPSPKSKTKA